MSRRMETLKVVAFWVGFVALFVTAAFTFTEIYDAHQAGEQRKLAVKSTSVAIYLACLTALAFNTPD